ncbi:MULTISPECIES: glycosyltransferase family 4 protein [Microbacterium]|uniref:glycosyltransferase family 4 protein n=1 Tax=Microbacterium TaxID=33882 RepID=UPI00217DC0B8|nr:MULTISPECIES: glycosyltransferase family 4 protein [Microbacterium]UWF77372.1 glycosyltransferase family 4 protein [Microbacterium neungamense]WCM55534.1 glycosyltransferase family 4 protein [Microbacterium sp. EF45047]
MHEDEAAAAAVMLVCDYSLKYLGGAQTAFIRQAQALAGEGHPVVVVAPDADAIVSDEAAQEPATPAPHPESRIVTVSPPRRGTIPVLDLPLLGRARDVEPLLAATARRHRVTVIVVHSEFALAAAAIAVGRRLGIPVLHTVHTFFWRAPGFLAPFAPLVTRVHRALTGIGEGGRFTGSHPLNNALRTMTLRVAERADVVLSPSRHQAEALRAAGAGRVEAFSNVSQPLRSVGPAPGEGPLRLLWVARFAPEKRIDVALDAMRLLHDELGPGRVHLDVAGGTRRPAPGVTFHGPVPPERVSELMTAADAALITSLGFDNQPMVALEAFSHGRPVIVSDPVLATEFGDAAIGTPGTDARALADEILLLEADRSLLDAPRAAALAYARERQPDAHVARLLEIAASVAERPGN